MDNACVIGLLIDAKEDEELFEKKEREVKKAKRMDKESSDDCSLIGLAIGGGVAVCEYAWKGYISTYRTQRVCTRGADRSTFHMRFRAIMYMCRI